MLNKIIASIDTSKSLFHEFDKKVEAGELSYIDMHGHIFNNSCVPDDFLVERMPFVQKALTEKHVLPVLLKLLRLWPGNEDKLELAADYVQNGSYGMRQLIESWLHIYRSFERKTGKNWAITPLMMDFEANGSFVEKPRLGFANQAAETMRYANIGEFKGRVLPFVFLDPRRENLQDIIIKALNQGAVGVKTYPSLGYLPSHPIAMQYWAAFEKLGIPVISHCSQNGKVHTHAHRITVPGEYNKKGELIKEPKTYNFSNLPWGKKYNDFFNHPSRWEPVLKQYPKLKLDIAHLGGLGDELPDVLAGKQNTWFASALKLALTYENVRIDLSYVSNNDKIRAFVLKLLQEHPEYIKIFMFGTDFYMSTINKKPGHMVKDSLTDYKPYLPQLALDNFRNWARPN